MSFAIEDVRETFERDLAGAVATLGTGSDQLLTSLRGFGVTHKTFTQLGDVFHTVYGTTQLVGAASIADTASQMEDLCRQGAAVFRVLEHQRANAQRIAALCAETARHFHALVELELAGRRSEAVKLGQAYRAERVRQTISEVEVPLAEEPAAPDEFMFGDAPEAEVTDSPRVGHQPAREAPRALTPTGAEEPEFVFSDGQDELVRELLPIFHHETRESMTAISAQLAAVANDRTNLSPVALLERAFHKLKGAASVLGLNQVSEQCMGLQTRLQALLDSESEVSRGSLQTLIAETNRMLVGAGLADLVVTESALRPQNEDDADARRIFHDEAESTCQRALLIADELLTASVERLRELSAEVGGLFHRLRGSALLCAAPQVAEDAGQLSDAAESSDTLSAAQVSTTVARIASALGLELDRTPAPGQAVALQASTLPGMVRETVQIIDDPNLLATVMQDCTELLDAIDKAVLELETTDRPQATISDLFRYYHTLKGVVNTAGIGPTGRVLHRVEDFLELLQEASVLPPPRAIANLLLGVQAEARRQIEQSRLGHVDYSMARLEAAVALATGGGEPSRASHSSDASRGTGDYGTHTKSVVSDRTGGAEPAERRYIRVEAHRLDALMNLAGELVVNRSRLTTRAQSLKRLQRDLGKSSRRLVESVDRFRDEHEFSLLSANGAVARTPKSPQRPAVEALPDRMQGRPLLANFSELELDRYDEVNLLARKLAETTGDVSEISTEVARELGGFIEDSDVFGSVVSGIQNEVTRARMVELDVLFTRVRLQVRDAAERDGKEVRVQSRGENVSLDKAIADALFAPLMHLVRNAVVHGIEGAEQRVLLGKPPQGTVRLSGREESGQVVIEVSDDGAGLNLAALRERGAELGLVEANVALDDPRVKELVFAPGLSTEAVAGDVSGRGVGGDVVRRSVERMNGSVRVDSVAGKGTTFTLLLPVTLSITRALLLQQAARKFAIPLHFCERILDTADAVLVESAGVQRVLIDGAYLPIQSLDDVLAVSQRGPASGPIVVLRMGQQRVCLQVEKVSGQEEIVVKGVGDLLAGHPLLAGAMIRGDGELALILDVPSMIEAKLDKNRAARPERRALIEAALPDGPAPLASPAPDRSSRSPLGSPSSRMPPEGAGRQAESRAVAATAKTDKLRVLFADDSLSVRRVAEKAFHTLGTDVTVAVDGVDALDKLRAATFDIIFTDLEMPRMHGYDLIREVRMHAAYRMLPIVVVSSRSTAKHREQALALGATEYLTKPFSSKSLEGALERCCRARVGAALEVEQGGVV